MMSPSLRPCLTVAGLCGVLFSAGSAGAVNECDPAKSPALLSKTSAARVQSIKACLDAVATPLAAGMQARYHLSPTRLFSFGPKVKITNLLKSSADQAYDFTAGFQNRREERQALTTFTNNRTPTILQIATTADQAGHDLLDMVAEIHKLPAPSDDQKNGLLMASFAKFYPNFIDHVQHGLGTVTGQSKSWQDGAKLGSTVAPGFDSTAGIGLYLTLEPETAVEHMNGGDALACELKAPTRAIDTDDPVVKQELVNAHILLPNLAPLPLIERKLASPTGKNLYVAPLDVEAAARGSLVAFKPDKLTVNPAWMPYVVDKGAIDYKKQCHLISVDDFTACDDFDWLLGSGFYHDKVQGSLLAVLKSRPKFTDKLFAIWKACVLTDKKLVCDTLINTKLSANGVGKLGPVEPVLTKDGRKQFIQVLTQCGCNPSEKAGKLSYNCPTL